MARALADDLDLPYVELDSIHWLPDWEDIDAEVFRKEVQGIIDENPDGWVIDGNYVGKLQGLVTGQAETVVYVDMPWRVWFWRVFWRSMTRAWRNEHLWNGNRETWRNHFLSRDSLILFMLKRFRNYRGKRVENFRAAAGAARFIQLSSRGALNRFYKERGLDR